MTTKLTLKLKKSTVERGKRYARKKRTSLSKLVEGYLDKVTEEPGDSAISPLVKSLSGIIKAPTVDWKKGNLERLERKYK
jgi:hypothetical protein